MIRNIVPKIPVPSHIQLMEQKLNCHAVFVNEAWIVGNLISGNEDSNNFTVDSFYRFGNLSASAVAYITIPDAKLWGCMLQLGLWALDLRCYQGTKIIQGQSGQYRYAAEWQYQEVLFNNLEIETSPLVQTGLTFENIIVQASFTGYKFIPN